MDPEQQERFKQAVEKKKEEAREASHTPPVPRGAAPEVAGVSPDGEMDEIIGKDRVQDTSGPRDKNSRHRKVSADKWNQ